SSFVSLSSRHPAQELYLHSSQPNERHERARNLASSARSLWHSVATESTFCLLFLFQRGSVAYSLIFASYQTVALNTRFIASTAGCPTRSTSSLLRGTGRPMRLAISASKRPVRSAPLPVT